MNSEGSPFEREENWQKLLGGIYDALGEDYLREGLRKRGISDDEIEQIVRELAEDKGGAA